MGLEDYFPWGERKERSPLTIEIKAVITVRTEKYRVSITDKEGYLVRDNKTSEIQEAKKEEERLKRELTERGYSFTD